MTGSLVGRLRKNPATSTPHGAVEESLRQGLAKRIAKDGQSAVITDINASFDEFATYREETFKQYARSGQKVPDNVLQDFSDYEELSKTEALFRSSDREAAAGAIQAIPLHEMRAAKDRLKSRINFEVGKVRTLEQQADLTKKQASAENEQLKTFGFAFDNYKKEADAKVAQLDALDKEEFREAEGALGTLETGQIRQMIKDPRFEGKTGISHAQARKYLNSRQVLEAETMTKQAQAQTAMASSMLKKRENMKDQRGYTLDLLNYKSKIEMKARAQATGGPVKGPDGKLYAETEIDGAIEREKENPVSQATQSAKRFKTSAQENILIDVFDDLAAMEAVMSGGGQGVYSEVLNSGLEERKTQLAQAAVAASDNPAEYDFMLAELGSEFMVDELAEAKARRKEIFSRMTDAQKDVYDATRKKISPTQKSAVQLMAQDPLMVATVPKNSVYYAPSLHIQNAVEDVIRTDVLRQTESVQVRAGDDAEDLVSRYVDGGGDDKSKSPKKLTQKEQELRMKTALSSDGIRNKTISAMAESIQLKHSVGGIQAALAKPVEMFVPEQKQAYEELKGNLQKLLLVDGSINAEFMHKPGVGNSDEPASRIRWNDIINSLVASDDKFNNRHESANMSLAVRVLLDNIDEKLRDDEINRVIAMSAVPQTVQESILSAFVNDYDGQNPAAIPRTYMNTNYQSFLDARAEAELYLEDAERDIGRLQKSRDSHMEYIKNKTWLQQNEFNSDWIAMGILDDAIGTKAGGSNEAARRLAIEEAKRKERQNK